MLLPLAAPHSVVHLLHPDFRYLIAVYCGSQEYGPFRAFCTKYPCWSRYLSFEIIRHIHLSGLEVSRWNGVRGALSGRRHTRYLCRCTQVRVCDRILSSPLTRVRLTNSVIRCFLLVTRVSINLKSRALPDKIPLWD
jgi:hypothetical protein